MDNNTNEDNLRSSSLLSTSTPKHSDTILYPIPVSLKVDFDQTIQFIDIAEAIYHSPVLFNHPHCGDQLSLKNNNTNILNVLQVINFTSKTIKNNSLLVKAHIDGQAATCFVDCEASSTFINDSYLDKLDENGTNLEISIAK